MKLGITRTTWRRHPAVRSGDQLTLGERVADRVVAAMGSWTFIIAQSIVMGAWVAVNVCAAALRWDAYPFVLLNLGLSTQAAYAASLILIASRRSDQKTSERAEYDLRTNLQALSLLQEVNARLARLEEKP